MKTIVRRHKRGRTIIRTHQRRLHARRRMAHNHPVDVDNEPGWVLKKIDAALTEGRDEDNVVGEFECNELGCHEKRKFKFNISDMIPIE